MTPSKVIGCLLLSVGRSRLPVPPCFTECSDWFVPNNTVETHKSWYEIVCMALSKLEATKRFACMYKVVLSKWYKRLAHLDHFVTGAQVLHTIMSGGLSRVNPRTSTSFQQTGNWFSAECKEPRTFIVPPWVLEYRVANTLADQFSSVGCRTAL